MSIVLQKINKLPQKNNDNKLKTLKEYMNIAKRCISYFGNETTIKIMINNEDAISYVIEHIIIGDIKWDSSRGMSAYNYRNNCARWAILSWMFLRQKKIKNKPESITEIIYKNNHSGTWKHETIENLKTKNPLQEAINNEEKEELKKYLTNANLSEREMLCIEYKFFDNMTYKEIADILNVNKYVPQLTINKALRKIRKYVKLPQR